MNNALSSGITGVSRPQVIPKLLTLGVLALLAVLQSTIINAIGLINIKPDLLLIAVIISALGSSWKWALFYGFLAGALKDVLGSGSFGFYSVMFASFGYLCRELSKSLMIDSRLRLVITVSLAAALEYIILSLFLALSGDPVPIGIFLRSTLIGSAYSAAFSPLVSALFKLTGK
jgi:rod shape-determining protein MreD